MIVIEDSNLSRVWARAIQPMLATRGPAEIAPLCVSVTGFDNGIVREDTVVRKTLDSLLDKANKQSCHTVANTIFPSSLWNPNVPRSEFFERYERSRPRIKKASKKNQHGMYFERLVQGGPEAHPNQLDFIIETYMKRKGVRRSALQIGIFDPSLDQTTAAQRGFPCLQHITFAPVGDRLNLNAFYATQYAFERAYGNYLGLCRLGRFVAHELDLELARVTCFTGIFLRDGLSMAFRQKLAKAIQKSMDTNVEG